MKKITVFLVCASLLVGVGCFKGTPNPRSQVITTKNVTAFLNNLLYDESTTKPLEETLIQEINGFKRLSRDEVSSFGSYLIIYALASDPINKNHSHIRFGLAGKTVKEIIKFQRQWDKERDQDTK